MSTARTSAGRRVPAPRPAPERSGDFDHLTLPALRGYRRGLAAEEGRVSYWRRILQARLDVLRAGSGSGRIDLAALRPVLAETRTGAGRLAVVDVVEGDDVPPLPDLAELWDRDVDPGDLAGTADLLEALEAAETQLSAYRSALHHRLAAATTELIARYRQEPTLCLSALPLPPARPRLVASPQPAPAPRSAPARGPARDRVVLAGPDGR